VLTKGNATIEIAAPPEAVYLLLSNIERIGEFSPECVRAEWHDGVTAPHAGARFTGHNERGAGAWSVECRVLRAMPGEEWAFKANFASPTPTTWRYLLERTPGGCTVTESWDAPLLATPEGEAAMAGRDAQLADNVSTSLQNLKRLAEK
jgi:uncharacterized protein YndB with AHSA1/START domain